MSETRARDGVLLVYHRPALVSLLGDASNVAENIAAFARHSRFPVSELNTEFGCPPGLAGLEFEAIVLHYSVFVYGPDGYLLDEELREYLGGSSAYKVAFFQDEYTRCAMRFRFVDEYGVDCVFSLLEPPHAARIYGERTRAERVVSHLPGYVGPELMDAASRFREPDEEREVDIGYRGRRMPPYAGRGTLEKTEIAERFSSRAGGSGVKLDLSVSEEDRFYGDDWPRFVARCRGVLGAESGASCFDLEDEVLEEYEHLSEGERVVTIEELERGALGRWDWKIPYWTIGPRHFEAAALGTCQILLEGRYSDLMEPMRHYIPLRKDYSNVDEVLERFSDRATRAELTENAHRDLIASGEHSYERFIERFDAVLLEAGLRSGGAELEPRVSRELRPRLSTRILRRRDAVLGWAYLRHRALWRVLFTAQLVVAAPFRLMRRITGRR